MDTIRSFGIIRNILRIDFGSDISSDLIPNQTVIRLESTTNNKADGNFLVDSLTSDSLGNENLLFI